ncbi:MAG: DUF5916 domain-containing protein [Owenweeksia sp.]|nr:DUF5916 domain-containing protein [Owenweeksia sp.]
MDQKYSISGFVSTDYRKTLALDANAYYEHWMNFNRDQYTLALNPRLRVGDHFFSILTLELSQTNNDYGYAKRDETKVIYGRRDRQSVTTAIDARYVFDNTKTISLVGRHFWTGLFYKQMYELQLDGSLSDTKARLQQDLNFNTLTVDMRFSWWYAPGSELVLLYRYVVAASGDAYQRGYWDNLNNAINAPIQHNLSLRLTYFLDYNRVKDIFLKPLL